MEPLARPRDRHFDELRGLRSRRLHDLPAGWLRRLRSWLLPEALSGWPALVWLSYLPFLLLPLVAEPRGDLRWLWPTLATLPVFLWLYFAQFRRKWRGLKGAAAMACLSYVLTPVNPAAFTYLSYAVGFSVRAVRTLPAALSITAAMLGLQAVEMAWLRQPPLNIAIAAVICVAGSLISYFQKQAWRKNVALKLSHAEIRRLAATAERERIGRDLHDLLGHTLSLVALKSELAGKLIERDRAAAEREIAEVTHIAREALHQVRTAVTGMRAATLRSELVSARALLESSGVSFDCDREELVLSPDLETALAMTVREAATNIQRHSGATRAAVGITTVHCGGEDWLEMRISDDGRGGASPLGNGLTGMAERIRVLGGELRVESPGGRGTVLHVSLPMAQARQTSTPGSAHETGSSGLGASLPQTVQP